MTKEISSSSPINGEVLWRGQPTPPDEIQSVMKRAENAFRSWRRVPTDQRIEAVRHYEKQLRDGRDQITDLITREVGKLGWDAAAEVGAAIAKIELSITAFQQRRDTHSLDAGKAGAPRRRVRFHPLGVTLVLGPFNFPLHLPGGQIIPALLAGNSVVFKPSDQATAIGQWMIEAWKRSDLPSDVLQMITGGVDTAVAAIDAPEVAGVFLTGSLAAGRAIHRQLAGRPDVLLALELGGNNPVVIHDDVPADTVASVVSFSAFITSGQRCTCARRAIFVEGESTASQIDALVDRTRRLSTGMPGDDPAAHVGPLISAGAAAGLETTYQRLLGLGCKPIIPFEVDRRAPNLLGPVIVDATELGPEALTTLGRMEWFGPILVIQRVAGFEAAVESAGNTSYGLAASLLGGTEEMFEHLVAEVGAGVVNWNGPTTGAAGALPFGGLGDSGNHRPAGFYAIDFCSDPIASLENGQLPTTDPWGIAK